MLYAFILFILANEWLAHEKRRKETETNNKKVAS